METEYSWHRYLFEVRKLEAAEVKSIEKKEVIDFLSQYLHPSSPAKRKLSIHIWGGNAQAAKSSGKVWGGSAEATKTSKENRESMEVTIGDSSKDVMIIDDLVSFKFGKELYPPGNLCARS